ncbi:MAG: bifunctional (p)ppGpp synthetase/guanosine-3',5'-bis(diphosphate) 3'-pyrophosphohydrolase [Nitrospirae bacterium]|nr:bifunctional (p)ppGpp synthetase/guanosine-3',5'-bis(diphosphate) 3'-pyrophosphohydrolase [Nitrospirota bacterium]
MPNVEGLIEKVLEYIPHADVGLIRRVYAFSANAHKGQVRKSGEPFLRHPLEVAHILARMKMDIASIVAGLLHDTVEDSLTTSEDIAKEFGRDIADLVEGLTKLSKVEFMSREEKQAENFRKMIISMGKDVRVILIKLADRLHNMRTLSALSITQQKRISQETMEIYAPIANRLGIGWMKIELEDLSLRYLKPDIYTDLAKKISLKKAERDRYIHQVIEIVKQNLKIYGVTAEVYGRTKHFYSIYQKMEAQGVPFEEIYDLTGIRIITDTKVNCYTILGMIHSLWIPVPGRFKDYIGVPKSNMYQSLHTTVIGPAGHRVEFQIRTDDMHEVAEEGIAAHWKYKDKGQAEAKDNQIYNWLRQMVEWQKDLSDSKQFLDSVKVDLFPDVVYVFTPRGDVKEMIRGATPVDFAYSIHTEIGNKCVGAKINGKMVPLRYQLKSGDTVEVITNPNHVPSKDWLKFVKTPSARAKLKHYIKTEERKRSHEIGRKLIEKELHRIGSSFTAVNKLEILKDVFNEYSVKDIEELSVLVGYGKVSPKQIMKKLFPESVEKEEGKEKEEAPKRVRVPGGVKVTGIDDILIHFSKCCNPVPGDKILGYITRGRGISIHTPSCPNIDELDYDKERLVSVEWDTTEPITYPVRISVSTIDRPGVLASVSAAITSSAANISHAEITTTEDRRAILNFIVDVKDLTHLERAIQKIEQVNGVVQVRRLMGR